MLMKYAAQALDAEALNEAHAAHIRGKIINFHGAFAGSNAAFLVAEIQTQALHTRQSLIPFGERLLVNRSDAGESPFMKIAHQPPQ